MRPELRLLGGGALIAPDGQPVVGAAAQSRRLAVLAVLAEAWPSAVTRDRMIGLIWPEQAEAGARRLLTQALYELRRALGPIARGSGRDLVLDPDALTVDLVELRRALEATDLEGAVSRYRGPFLDGFHLRGELEFERWAEGVRDAVHRDVRRAIESLAKGCAEDGRVREAAQWSERLVQLSPYDGEAVLRAMELFERADDTPAALAVAAVHERRMREELELAPASTVTQRVEALRALSEARVPVPRASTDAKIETTESSPPPIEESVAPRIDAPARSGARRLVALGAAAVAALVVLAVVLRIGSLTGSPRPVPAANPTRALPITPFLVRGEDAHVAGLGDDVLAILASNLDGVAGVRIDRPPRRADDSVGLAPLRRLVSSAAGSWAVLGGEIVATGGQLRIDADLRLSGPSGRRITVTVSGPRDSLITLAERLSLGLLPAMYADSAAIPDAGVLARFTRVQALRRYLDGETAWRRGAYDEAHAALRLATELDSSIAYVWYRRAFVAELAHDGDDADRAIEIARTRTASSSERERILIDAYASWRAGDAEGAETVFRRLLERNSRDRDAWYHLAEIAYHAWPLRGRSLDDAADPWRQLVTLDSGHFPALTHAIRLEARSRDTARVAALLRRSSTLRSEGPAAAEARVVAAYAVGAAAGIAAVQGELDTLPGYSLGFLHATIAGLLEQPQAAEPIARRMTRASQPRAVQGEGRLALAHLALAQGRWRDASRELDLAAGSLPVAAAWSRGYFATLPFLQAPASVREAAVHALANAPITRAAAPLYLQLAVDVSAAPVLERYLGTLLDLAGAKTATAPLPALPCASGVSPNTQALCSDLQRGLDAEQARRGGRPTEALRSLESLGMRVPYQYAGRSMFFARSRERYLRADLLERAGRFEEAYAWYAAVPHGAWMDYLYLAPSHLRRGRILEHLGNSAGAAGHYRQALRLWGVPDPEMAALRREAEAGLKRVAGAP
jgi:DNA-binding SARP family transcriptional activator/tetratricopeptide (TPR) repeat protein